MKIITFVQCLTGLTFFLTASCVPGVPAEVLLFALSVGGLAMLAGKYIQSDIQAG